MYQIGDQIVYGIHGVCNVVDEEKRMIDKKMVTYLVLEPVVQTGSRYLVPMHNKAAMAKLRKMLSQTQIQELLSSPEMHENCWIRDENQRKQTYRELISCGDWQKLLSMVNTLYLHKAEQTAAGKKCHLCDENFLRDAEKLLSNEISIVMGIPTEESRTYLKTQLKRE